MNQLYLMKYHLSFLNYYIKYKSKIIKYINKYKISNYEFNFYFLPFHNAMRDRKVIMNSLTDGNPHYKRATKTLYLMHGFSGNSTDWVTGSNAMDISRKYNLAIVMPSGENSFYLNRKGTGMSYETFIVEELFDYITSNFGLSKAPEDNFIGGLSMGGFGALRLGAKYNKKYGAIFGLSSAMIIRTLWILHRKRQKPCRFRLRTIITIEVYLVICHNWKKVIIILNSL